MKMEGKLEPIVLLLFFGMVFFTVALFFCEHFYPNDGQLFQVVSGLLTGFAGAFFMRVKPQSPNVPSPTLTPNPPDQEITATLTPASTDK